MDDALGTLHDEVAQDLFVARSALFGLRGLLPDDAPARTLAELATRGVESALQQTCDLVSGLRAGQASEDGDLSAALQRVLVDVAVPAGIGFTYRETGLGADPPADSLPSIVGIVREALANVREHAAASEVKVSVHRHAAWTRIAVADNGHGLEAAADHGRGPHAHFGLAEMQLRAKALGGHVALQSRPGAGMTVIIDLPPARAPRDGQ